MRTLFFFLFFIGFVAQAQAPSDVKKALVRAVTFYHREVATHGGYVYQYSADLKLREAEGVPGKDTIWVQPPGTPAVGLAMLEAYEATGEKECLDAALVAGRALARGQLQSGGWYYSISFGDRPASKFYRRDKNGKLQNDPTPLAERTGAGGWTLWKKRVYEANISTYDDDVTFAALRFLIRLDGALKFADEEVHDAALYGLKALMGTQFPNGAWATSFDRFPSTPPDIKQYPILRASLPETWPQKWPKDFTGCYVTNDELMSRGIDTLLLAYKTYQDEKYLNAARRAGDFLILAQLPEPQPAWAQQYNAQMQPVWGRAFEPTALTSRESENIMRTLIALFRISHDKKYLEPIPRALSYLRRSLRPDGNLARFYEIGTNKPLYFTRGAGGQGHILTYSDQNLASNYGFVITPQLDAIEADYQAALKGQSAAPLPTPAQNEIQKIIASLDARGAWTQPGTVRDAQGRKQQPQGGIIRSATFIENVRALCRFMQNKP